MQYLKAFASGFIAVLVGHHPALWLLKIAGLTGRAPYSLEPTKPFGVPTVLSLSFWGGVWGIVLWLVIRRLRNSPNYWTVAFFFGGIALTLVAVFVAAPLKGQPVGGNWKAGVVGFIVNAVWGLVTAALMKLFERRAAATAVFTLLVSVGCSSGSAPAPRTVPEPAASNVEWDLPNLDHERVDYWVERFSRGDKRAELEASLQRWPEHAPAIIEELGLRRLPRDLVYLAMIESSLNPEAHSAAGARGIWQLMPDVARQYGLRVDEEVDERRDPVKSMKAAISYLSDLRERFGSWYLAAAAYNAGPARVAAIMKEATGSERGTDADYYRFWDRWPGETRDFVPVMIATARIVKERGRSEE